MILVRKLTSHTAILAFLIPAKSSVWNCLRTDELKTTQKRVSFGHKETFAHDRDFDQLLVWTKNFPGRHSPAFVRCVFHGHHITSPSTEEQPSASAKVSNSQMACGGADTALNVNETAVFRL